MFALYGRPFRLCDGNGGDLSAINPDSLHRGTVYVCGPEDKTPTKTVENGPISKFLNVEKSGRKGTVLLENPKGQPLFKTDEEAKKFVESLL